METQDLDGLLEKLETANEEDTYDYSGYTVLDDLKMTKEDLKSAVDIMWEIVMTMDAKQRDETYLFGKGLIRSKNIFLAQHEKRKDLPSDKKETFNYKADIFKERLENSKPLIQFLIKIKDLL